MAILMILSNSSFVLKVKHVINEANKFVSQFNISSLFSFINATSKNCINKGSSKDIILSHRLKNIFKFNFPLIKVTNQFVAYTSGLISCESNLLYTVGS